MKVWVCLELRECGPLGRPSRAGAPLAGRPALERTALRAGRTPGIAGVAVLVEPGRAGEARRLLGAAAGARVLEVLGADHPRREALRRARKWSGDSWRGGIRQTVEFDAGGEFGALAAAAKELGADAVLCVTPESALVDPAILEGLIRHAAPEGRIIMRLAMCQAPAGFAGALYAADWLGAAAASGTTAGEVLGWKPGKGGGDPIGRPENFLCPAAVGRCEFRGAVDSERSREVVEEILRRAPLADGLGPAAEEAAAIVAGDAALYAGRRPRRVEVELTTAGRVPFKDTPAAAGFPERRMSRALFEKLLADLAAYDDVLVTFGGVGDPLAHPEVFDFLKLARARGIHGLHLDTPGVLLDEAAARRLLECDLDVVSVRLGAAKSDTYAALTGRNDFEAVAANVERLVALRRESGREWPFVLVEAEKRVEAEPELLDFFDRWTEQSDGAVIRPFSDYCGQLPDRASVHLTLAERAGCRRLMKEMLVLADGTVPVCRMDFRAAEPAGNLATASVEELWTAGRIAALRAEQSRKKFDGFRLCPQCRDWDNV